MKWRLIGGLILVGIACSVASWWVEPACVALSEEELLLTLGGQTQSGCYPYPTCSQSELMCPGDTYRCMFEVEGEECNTAPIHMFFHSPETCNQYMWNNYCTNDPPTMKVLCSSYRTCRCEYVDGDLTCSDYYGMHKALCLDLPTEFWCNRTICP